MNLLKRMRHLCLRVSIAINLRKKRGANAPLQPLLTEEKPQLLNAIAIGLFVYLDNRVLLAPASVQNDDPKTDDGKTNSDVCKIPQLLALAFESVFA